MCAITFNWGPNNAVEKVKKFEISGTATWAVIELTSFCHFNCKWCFANSGLNSNSNAMHIPVKKLEKLIQVLADSGIKQITYSGGEPTLYPHLIKAIKLAKGNEMIVHMNTNGYLLSRELSKMLKEAGLSQVEINIDSLVPDKHDYIRGKKGSFKKAVKALKNALSTDITCVSQTVLTKENEGEIFDIFKFARGMGVQRCRVWDMTPSKGRAETNADLMPTQYLDIVKKLSIYAMETGATSIETGEPLFPLDWETNLRIVGGYCVFGIGLVIYIPINGDVPFCCTYRKPMYNIFDAIKNQDKIEELHKNKLKEQLQSFKIPLKCMSCKFFEKCRGGCVTRRMYSATNEDYMCQRLRNNPVAPIYPIYGKSAIQLVE